MSLSWPMLSKKDFAGISEQHCFKIKTKCVNLIQKSIVWIRSFHFLIPQLFCRGSALDGLRQQEPR